MSQENRLSFHTQGLPYSFYHGRTGIVFNVNRNALGALLSIRRSYSSLDLISKMTCHRCFVMLLGSVVSYRCPPVRATTTVDIVQLTSLVSSCLVCDSNLVNGNGLQQLSAPRR